MGTGPTHDHAGQVRDAVDRTLQAGTAHIRQTMLGLAGRVVATGTVDFTQRRATAVLSLPPHPDAPDPQAATDVAMIIDGVVTYTQVLDRPGRWIADRLADPGQALSAGDPGLLLELLRGTVAATVADDDPASRAFDVELDLDRAMERAPDDLRRQLREAYDGALRTVRSRSARVRLDGDGRIHRIDLELDPSDEQPVERLEVELFDLGAEVTIELPEASAVLDAEEMAALGAELAERFGDGDPTRPDHRPPG